jgi:hypothetical protein
MMEDKKAEIEEEVQKGTMKKEDGENGSDRAATGEGGQGR